MPVSPSASPSPRSNTPTSRSPSADGQPVPPLATSSTTLSATHANTRLVELLGILLVWAVVYAAALFAPPLLDDADATHAQAAQAMLRTGDWVTLHVNGIRYLEKPPLPYWLTAFSLRLFGNNSFAVHLPLALAMLALAVLAWVWGNQLADGDAAAALATDARSPKISGASAAFTSPSRTGLYAALFMLTAAGAFLFTRIFIPEALLSFLLAFTLYAFLRALSPQAEKFNIQSMSKHRHVAR